MKMNMLWDCGFFARKSIFTDGRTIIFAFVNRQTFNSIRIENDITNQIDFDTSKTFYFYVIDKVNVKCNVYIG